MSQAVEQRLDRLSASPSARFAQASSPAEATGAKPSFFKSPKGIAVLVLMAAGTGYTIYSATQQRIANPVR